MIKDFAEKLLGRALEKGFADAEIYAAGGNSLSISILNGEIDKYQNSSSRGISFRGTYNGKMGYAYSERIDADGGAADEIIGVIISEAMQNSEILEEKEQDKLFAGFAGENYAKVSTFYEELRGVPTEDRIKAALALEKTAKAGEYIAAVDHCGVSYGEGSTLIMNTRGLNLEHRSNSASASVSARAVRSGGAEAETKVGGEWWNGIRWGDFDPEKLGREAASDAAKKLGAEQAASGKYKIVMKNTAFANLVSTYSSVILADAAQKGLSLLAGKLGEKIASENFTLLDAPLYPEREQPFDNEGVATYDKPVIEGGVFRTFLHNLKTAAKDGVKSTGNASGGYRSPIRVSPRNLYVKPGELSRGELIKQAGDGLYITSLAGLHSGTNAVSGDFSLLAEGFIIENGEIARPVEQITVAGNFFDVLKDIEAVANEDDLRWGSMGSPAVLLGGLNVAGS